MSLSDFIKRELERAVERPTMRECLERTQQAKPISSKRSAAQLIRELGFAMIVLDASVVVEFPTNGPLADPLRRDLG